jgi:hypothetical protein
MPSAAHLVTVRCPEVTRAWEDRANTKQRMQARHIDYACVVLLMWNLLTSLRLPRGEQRDQSPPPIPAATINRAYVLMFIVVTSHRIAAARWRNNEKRKHGGYLMRVASVFVCLRTGRRTLLDE